MGAPVPQMNPAEDVTAETLLSSLRTIDAAERRKHASVYSYWLSIRGSREFPPIHDLDALEISDAGPFSILLEMIGGGEDAEIRHLGQAIGAGIDADKISDAPNPSILSCIATRLQVVAASRDAFAFEDEFEGPEGKTRCWVTLLPFSATGTWIDFVYGLVSIDPPAGAAATQAADSSAEPQPPVGLADVLKLADTLAEADSELASSEPVTDFADAAEATAEPVPDLGDADDFASEGQLQPEAVAVPEPSEPEPEAAVEAQSEPESVPEAEAPPEPENVLELNPEPEAAPESKPEQPTSDDADGRSGKLGFSAKFFEKLASAGGFYGRPVEVELDLETASLESWEADETAPPIEPVSNESNPKAEGTLQSKLTEVRNKADEARQAKLRANVALYEGLSAAYDFALDAEDSPEEYLRLLEAQGLKIQLRSPMKPVVKLAFNGMCDDSTIQQLEAVLAWAFDEELARGTLAERIESEGGIGPILSGLARAA